MSSQNTQQSDTQNNLSKEVEKLSIEEQQESGSWFESTEKKEGIEALEEPKPFTDKEAIKDQQNDPNDPLFSEVKSFKELGLREELLKGVHAMGFDKPSSVQGKTLPLLIKENINMIAQSQSGTGKTACFALAMLTHVDENLHKPQAICVCNTLELAKQIGEVTQSIGKFTKIKVRIILKGVEVKEKITDQIIIGTPGKILDMIKKRIIDTRNVKMYVLDEADAMLEPGQNTLRTQTLLIKKYLPKRCRYLLFSATFQEGVDDNVGKDQDAKVLAFAKKFVPKPCSYILIPKEQLTLKGIKQFYIMCESEDAKYALLKNLYETLNIGQAIIFVNTREKANALTKNMRKEGFTVSILHGQMDPADRKTTISEFKKANTKVLITTNVLARGLDIQQVTHVINYDLPLTQDGKPDPSIYLHRIGRSGRFGRKGLAISFAVGEKDKKVLDDIAKFFSTKISEAPQDPEELIKIIK